MTAQGGRLFTLPSSRLHDVPDNLKPSLSALPPAAKRIDGNRGNDERKKAVVRKTPEEPEEPEEADIERDHEGENEEAEEKKPDGPHSRLHDVVGVRRLHVEVDRERKERKERSSHGSRTEIFSEASRQ